MELYLVFLSNMMLASRAALVAVMVEAFLWTLDCQTWLRALVVSQAAGRAFLWLDSKPRLKVISCAGWIFGRISLRQRIIQ